MKLIVGLGNPGRQYAATRHNIGWEVLDALAARLGWVAGPEEFDQVARSNFDGLTLDGAVSRPSGGTEKLLLLKPATYMNLSGKSVQPAMAFYQLAAADVMVVVDELALPCGKIRIRPGGSSGGHNGLKDIERALGTGEYPRLRIGIDPPPDRVPGRDYVLGRFSAGQREKIEPAIDRATSALLTWTDKGLNAAMNVYNTEGSP